MNKQLKQTGQEHVQSYYAAQLPVRSAYEGPTGQLDKDVAVIGGGLAGLTASRELAARGYSVILLEANKIGWGASGRNGGFVSPGYAQGIDAIEKAVGIEGSKRLYELSVSGMKYVEDTITALGRADIIKGRGWLHVIRHRKKSALQRWQEKMVSTYGANMQFWDAGELRQRLHTQSYRAGVADAGPFHIDPLAYAELLASACNAAGVAVCENARVANISRQGNRFQLVLTEKRVLVDNVVLATSAYGGPYSALERSVLPVATYVVTSKPGCANLASAINYDGCIADTRRAGDYYRVVRDNSGARLLWGGRITTQLAEPDDLAEGLRQEIQRIYPQLADIRIDYAWSGLMAYARHKMPIIGQISPGLYALTGFGGHGLNTTATGGVAVARAIAGDKDDMDAFQKFGLAWCGGAAGRLATQLEYRRLQVLDYIEEL